MGVVYKAKQLQANRIVALKMILSGQLAGAEEVARFKAEAEAVARLDHANIVPIFEVGEYEDRHFFSMAFVDGVSLKERMRDRRFKPREAADLIRTLAAAVHYAHGQGIVHRDLKPANILLDRKGHARITDFGLSKMQDDTDDLTGTGQLLGTPAYMSPEQATGTSSEIGPLSDVYALGAILYEMLCNRAPFREDSILDTLEQVRTAEPSPPRSFVPNLDRDIETICLKCLSKSPQSRYSSAIELADDLGKYLRNEPIKARRIHVGQKLLRWCQRKPVVAGLALTSILLCIVLVPLAAYFAQTSRSKAAVADLATEQAKQNLLLASNAANRLVEQAQMLSDIPKTETHRQDLLKQASDFYDDFLRQQPQNPRLRQQAAVVHRSMGDMYRLLGEFTAASNAYGSSVRQLQKLADEFPEEPEHRRQLATSQIWLAVLLNPKELDQSLESLNEAVSIYQRLTEQIGDDSRDIQGLAQAHYNRGMVHSGMGQPQRAEEDYETATDLLDQLQNQFPESFDETCRRAFARTLNNFGNFLKKNERLNEGSVRSQRAIELLQTSYNQGTLDREGKEELAIYQNNYANALMAQKKSDLASQQNQKSIELLEQLVEDFPRYPRLRNELANTYNSRGALQGRARKLEEAQESFEAAENTFAQLMEDYPEDIVYANRRGSAIYNIAVIDYMQLSYDRAAVGLHQAMKLHQQAVDTNNRDEKLASDLANDIVLLGKCYLATNAHRKTMELIEQSYQSFEATPKLRWNAAQWAAKCAKLVQEEVRLEVSEAEELMESYATRSVSLIGDCLGAKIIQIEDIVLKSAIQEPFDVFQGRHDFEQLIKEWVSVADSDQ